MNQIFLVIPVFNCISHTHPFGLQCNGYYAKKNGSYEGGGRSCNFYAFLSEAVKLWRINPPAPNLKCLLCTVAPLAENFWHVTPGFKSNNNNRLTIIQYSSSPRPLPPPLFIFPRKSSQAITQRIFCLFIIDWFRRRTRTESNAIWF